jgi:hypothetical protein
MMFDGRGTSGRRQGWRSICCGHQGITVTLHTPRLRRRGSVVWAVHHGRRNIDPPSASGSREAYDQTFDGHETIRMRSASLDLPQISRSRESSERKHVTGHQGRETSRKLIAWLLSRAAFYRWALFPICREEQTPAVTLGASWHGIRLQP